MDDIEKKDQTYANKNFPFKKEVGNLHSVPYESPSGKSLGVNGDKNHRQMQMMEDELPAHGE